jgi:hypothetical protein
MTKKPTKPKKPKPKASKRATRKKASPARQAAKPKPKAWHACDDGLVPVIAALEAATRGKRPDGSKVLEDALNVLVPADAETFYASVTGTRTMGRWQRFLNWLDGRTGTSAADDLHDMMEVILDRLRRWERHLTEGPVGQKKGAPIGCEQVDKEGHGISAYADTVLDILREWEVRIRRRADLEEEWPVQYWQNAILYRDLEAWVCCADVDMSPGKRLEVENELAGLNLQQTLLCCRDSIGWLFMDEARSRAAERAEKGKQEAAKRAAEAGPEQTADLLEEVEEWSFLVDFLVPSVYPGGDWNVLDRRQVNSAEKEKPADPPEPATPQSARSATPNTRAAGTPNTWHPCDDGLDPIAEALEKFARIQVFDLPAILKKGGVSPGRRLEMALREGGQHLSWGRREMVRRYLQTTGYIADSRELEGRLQGILDHVEEWETAAREDPCTDDNGDYSEYAPGDMPDDEVFHLRLPDEDVYIGLPGEKLWEFHRQMTYSAQHAADYVRQLSGMIRAKLTAVPDKGQAPAALPLLQLDPTVDSNDEGSVSGVGRFVFESGTAQGKPLSEKEWLEEYDRIALKYTELEEWVCGPGSSADPQRRLEAEMELARLNEQLQRTSAPGTIGWLFAEEARARAAERAEKGEQEAVKRGAAAAPKRAAEALREARAWGTLREALVERNPDAGGDEEEKERQMAVRTDGKTEMQILIEQTRTTNRLLQQQVDQSQQRPAERPEPGGPDAGGVPERFDPGIRMYAESLEAEALKAKRKAWQWPILYPEAKGGKRTGWMAGLVAFMTVLEKHGEEREHGCQDVNVWIIGELPNAHVEQARTAAQYMGNAKKSQPVMAIWRAWYVKTISPGSPRTRFLQKPRARQKH